jgi:hypothetical protein
MTSIACAFGLRQDRTSLQGRWFKDFGSFKLCGEGKYPKTFLLAGQAAMGEQL